MKKNFNSFILTFIVGTIIIFSIIACDKNTTTAPQIDSLHFTGISAQNGILAFESVLDFKSLYGDLATNEDLIEEFQLQFGDSYISQEDILEEIEEMEEDTTVTDGQLNNLIFSRYRAVHIDEDSTLETTVDEPIISLLLNSEGAMIIGDTLIAITTSFVRRTYFNPSTDNLNQVIDNLETYFETNKSDGVFVVNRTELEDDKNACNKKKCFKYKNSKRRTRGKFWKVKLGFFGSYGANTKYQRKKRWFWKRRKADLEVRASSELGHDASKSRNNKKVAHVLLEFKVCFKTNDEGDVVPEFECAIPDIIPWGGEKVEFYGDHTANDFQCETCRKFRP